MRRSGLGGLRSGEAGAALPRPPSAAPEDSQSNVITFRTPPSQRINDFDPTASALWPTWVALEEEEEVEETDEGDSYGG